MYMYINIYVWKGYGQPWYQRLTDINWSLQIIADQETKYIICICIYIYMYGRDMVNPGIRD